MANYRDLRGLFKVRIDYEGQTLLKAKIKGKKGLIDLFEEVDFKLK